MSSPNIANALSWGLLRFPSLFTDLSMMLASLDAGNIISPQSLPNKPLALYLDNLFGSMPLKSLNGGWCKDKDRNINSISGYVLNELLKLKVIVQPPELSASQTLSFRAAQTVLKDILLSYPELVEEIPGLLENMIGGGKVMLSGLENEEIAQLLGRFFDALGFKTSKNENDSDGDDDDDDEDDEGGGYRSLRTGDVVGHASLCHMMNVFKNAEKYASLKSAASESSKVSSSSSSSSGSRSTSRGVTLSEIGALNKESSEDQEGSSEEEGSATVEVQQPRVGPSMPTPAQLDAARQAGERYQLLEKGKEDAEDDEDNGPAPQKMTATSPAFLTSIAVPLGYTGVSAEELKILENSKNSEGDKLGGKKREIDEREEWMINPGEDRAIAGFETFGVSRKFQTGKKAKKVAEATTEMREAYELSMQNSEESLRTQAILEEFKEKRGASLMDRHVEKKAKQPKAAVGARRAFDRELDVLAHKGMGQNQVEQLVQHAKELDTRFDKGSVQRSFL